MFMPFNRLQKMVMPMVVILWEKENTFQKHFTGFLLDTFSHRYLPLYFVCVCVAKENVRTTMCRQRLRYDK